MAFVDRFVSLNSLGLCGTIEERKKTTERLRNMNNKLTLKTSDGKLSKLFGTEKKKGNDNTTWKIGPASFNSMTLFTRTFKRQVTQTLHGF